MEPRTVVSAHNLTKRYRDLVAVDGIDFAVRQGECFGFLGPNGAGKTSTLRMVSCLSPVSAGELTVDGMDVGKDQRAIKSVLGILSQADSLDPDLSVLQNLVAYGRYFDLPRKTAQARIWEVLDLFQLRPKADRRPDELSGGMRRRLLIARALLHQPKILVLDEPTTGLDPQSRHLVWEKLSALKSEGITLLLTSHNMEEAAYLCDRLVVMDNGKILVEGTPQQLVRDHAGEQVTQIRAGYTEKTQLMAALSDLGVQFDDSGDAVLVYQESGALPQAGLSLDGFQVVQRPGNLEDVFLRLTGREMRAE